MVSSRMRPILITSVSVITVAWALHASARPLYSPQSPSVEVHLEALRDLKQHNIAASPFANMPQGAAYVPPMRASSPAASGRQVPLMNRPYVTMPQVGAAPNVASAPPSQAAPGTATRMSLRDYQSQRGRTPNGYKIVASRPDGYGTTAPVAMPEARYGAALDTSRPMPPVIRDDEPLMPKAKASTVRTNLPPVEKLKSDEVKQEESAPPPVPKLPEVAKLGEPEAADSPTPSDVSKNLPEPDMDDMTFEDFPELKPLPEADSKLPEISPPEIAMPQVPRLPSTPPAEPAKAEIKAPNPDELMPSLSKGIDDFISNNQGQPSPSGGKAVSRLPQTPDVTPPAPIDMPDMPELPKAVQMPSDAPQEMAALPDMPVEFPALEAPPIDAPAAPASAGSAMLSLTFAATENEVPVSGQQQLAALATKLIASNQVVEIEPYVKGASDQDMVANRIATSRAFSVRTFLIDKGVKAENLIIGKRRINSDETAIEKVDIVAR